jgi:hypothetical protein
MKKIVLSLAGVLAATAFAPEASAVPSFARQTGRACSACHAQHFPVLNSVGQDFKASGYTQQGAKGKFKGEDMSIPDNLNASMLIKARYQMSNGPEVAGELSGETTNSGQWQIPDEYSLFLGGRIGENSLLKVGFLMEGNTAASPLVAGFKIPMVFDLESVQLMAIPFLTDALGSSYGFEQASTGAVRGVRWAEHRKEISAQQYIGTDGAATGLAFVAYTDMGYVNLSRWSPNFTASAGSGAIAFSSTYLRVAATPTIADWAMHIGLQSWSGENHVDGAGTLGTGGTFGLVDTAATALDFQAFGELAGMETGLYATYAKLPKSDAGKKSAFNKNGTVANDKSAVTFGADVSVIPHTLHVGAAYRAGTNAANLSDNAITGTVVYDLFQNVALHVNHSIYSGDAYTGTPADGTQLTTFMLEAAW